MSEIIPDILKEAKIYEQICLIDLWYPRSEGHTHTIELGLIDVRASDSIRIFFDFKRSGWVIQQPKVTYIPNEGENVEWIEVGFFENWALEGNENDK